MSPRLRLVPLAVAACLIPCAVQAQAQAQSNEGGRFAVGAQVGTPGLGLQAQWALSPKVVLRGGYDVLDWDRDQTYKGIDYEAKIDFKSPGAFLDLHPFENGFLVSGGAYFGSRKIDLDATPDRQCEHRRRDLHPRPGRNADGADRAGEDRPLHRRGL